MCFLIPNQFESNEDPLDKTTTAEAIRILVDYYRRSQYSYSANERVEEMSKVVSFNVSILCHPSNHVLLSDTITDYVFFLVYHRKEQC